MASGGDCKKGRDVNNASRQNIIIEQAQFIFCSSFVCVIIPAQVVGSFRHRVCCFFSSLQLTGAFDHRSMYYIQAAKR